MMSALQDNFVAEAVRMSQRFCCEQPFPCWTCVFRSRDADRTLLHSNTCVLGAFANCIGWFVVEDAEVWK